MTDGENQRLSRGLREIDTDEVDRAVELLREAGFAVDGIESVEPANHGVAFSLNLYANSRSAKLGSGPAAGEVEEFRESFEDDEDGDL